VFSSVGSGDFVSFAGSGDLVYVFVSLALTVAQTLCDQIHLSRQNLTLTLTEDALDPSFRTASMQSTFFAVRRFVVTNLDSFLELQ
jgi:hypothetical protein